MFIQTRRYVRPVATLGFVEGDYGYLTDPDNSKVQYQVRLSDFRGSKANATVLLTRHRETVDGKDQGVWLQWNTPKKPIVLKNVHLKTVLKSTPSD